MLKRFLSVALVMASFVLPSSASIFWLENDDIGDNGIKSGIQREMSDLENETGQAFYQRRTQLQDFKKGFIGLKEDELVALFGSKVEKKPNTFALPIYDSGGLVFSGLFSSSKPSKAHIDFYEIGDLAAAKVFYDRSGERVRGIFFYFRTNATFPKLEGWNNFKARTEWENSCLTALETWVAERKNLPRRLHNSR